MGPGTPTPPWNNGQIPAFSMPRIPSSLTPAVAPSTNSALVSSVAAPSIPAATPAVAPLPMSASAQSTMLPTNDFNFSYMGPSTPTARLWNNGQIPAFSMPGIPSSLTPTVAPSTN